MELTLADAAKMAGVNKSTLFRAIKSGKLSARRLDDKSFRIDPSELARVYALQQVPRGDDNDPQQIATASETAATSQSVVVELAILRVELAREREERARERETARETVEDLRKRLDRAEDRILALSAPQRAQEGPSAPTVAEKPARGRPSLLGRLLGW